MGAKSKRILALLNHARNRERMLQAMNRENMDDVGPIGADKGETFLKELNEMADLESKAGQEESPDR